MPLSLTLDLGRFLGVLGPALYTSPTAVLDELLQNSARARASSLLIWRVDHPVSGRVSLGISDNGDGLDDPTSLFRLATSSWTDEVQQADPPFGLGFWSILSLADHVRVRSRTWDLRIDLARIRHTHRVDDVITLVDGVPDLPGFHVHLFSPPLAPTSNPPGKPLAANPIDQPQVDAWGQTRTSTHAAVRDLVRYLPFQRVGLYTVSATDPLVGEAAFTWIEQLHPFLDKDAPPSPHGSFLHLLPSACAPFTHPTLSVPSRLVERPTWRGRLWAQPESWSPAEGAPWAGIRTYTACRPVSTLSGHHVGGELHLGLAYRPRVPDRKDWVQDLAWTTFLAELAEEVRALYLEVLRLPDAARYATVLSQILTPEEVLREARLELVNGVPYLPDPTPVTARHTATLLPPSLLAPRHEPRDYGGLPSTPKATDLPPSDGSFLLGCQFLDTDTQAPPPTSLWAVSFEDEPRGVLPLVLHRLHEAGASVIRIRNDLDKVALRAVRNRGTPIRELTPQVTRLETRALRGTPPALDDVPQIWTGLRHLEAWMEGAIRLSPVPLPPRPRLDIEPLTTWSILHVGNEEIHLGPSSNQIVAFLAPDALVIDEAYVRGLATDDPSPSAAYALALRLVGTIAHEWAHVGGLDHGPEHTQRMGDLLDLLLHRAAMDLRSPSLFVRTSS